MGSNGPRFSRRRLSAVSLVMATDSETETSCPGPPDTSATPPPSAAGDFRPTASAHVAIARTGRLPMGMPSGRYVLPSGCIDQYRNATVGSPSTPPEYCVARTNTPQPLTNHVARAAAAALGSNRDRQPLLIGECTLPLQDGTVSPTQYCMIGLVFAGVCVAAAPVIVDTTGRRCTTSHDLRKPLDQAQLRSPGLDEGKSMVSFPCRRRQNTPNYQGLNIFELFPNIANSVGTTVAADVDSPTVTTAVVSSAFVKRTLYRLDRFNAKTVSDLGTHRADVNQICYAVTPFKRAFCNIRRSVASLEGVIPQIILSAQFGLKSHTYWKFFAAAGVREGKLSL
ncbi:hypothetical protein HPB50_012541 [Hyalomma asiaticum]|uniref:Uncharacterized protein n=1 Tax=Hyalomma asiaticum TaxID=266040 RepID=A0ACB7S6A3_HYAAI|nr:hypothetical protein HPB50_012541 [Hyalomma asiaticum]